MAIPSSEQSVLITDDGSFISEYEITKEPTYKVVSITRKQPGDESKSAELSISVPEPPPKNEGVPIHPIALKQLKLLEERSMRTASEGSKEDIDRFRLILEQRYNFGMKKYGQCLMSSDGRNSIEDATQELGDLFVYMIKAKYEQATLPMGTEKMDTLNKGIPELRRMIGLVLTVLDSPLIITP